MEKRMANGKYLYCVIDGTEGFRFAESGLLGKRAYAVPYKDISAVVSPVPLKEMQPDAESITAHQRVVEESRLQGTILPVRFGIMFNSDENVKQMLAKSYKDLKSKIVKLRDKDEFGLKIIMGESELKKFASESDTPEIKKLRREMTSTGKGTAYFLKMKVDEAVRNETYKRIEKMSREIHEEVARNAKEGKILKSEFDQIILNASYLIERKHSSKFQDALETLKTRYRADGLIFHLSGPWAPYSFC